MRASVRMGLGLSCVCLALVASACGSDDSGGPTGGKVAGALDQHCKDPDGGLLAQEVGACLTDDPPANPATCSVTYAADPGAPDGGAPEEEEAPALYNDEGDDDDCKFHVRWTSTPVRRNADVSFTVSLTGLADGQPATCAGVYPELFLSDTHPAATPTTPPVEGPPGTYKIAPVRFDAAGRWTVRFHFYGECSDAPENSPHGHAAFYLDVP